MAPPVSLIRAAATCKPWRRMIAGRDGFVRCFRSLNGPHILGRYYYYGDGIRPIFVPLAAPDGKPAVDPERVSLDFLRSSYRRIPVLHDSRGGLLAFYLPFSVIICNPLTKQHMQIYATCPPCLQPRRSIEHCLGVFLLDGETGLGMSNFRVLWVRLIHDQQDGSKTVQACVFSATDRDNRWLPLSTRVIGDGIIPVGALEYLRVPLVFLGRAGGSLCWSVQGGSNVLLHLKESTGEFSYLRLPGQAGMNSNRRNLRVIGTVNLVRIVGNNLEILGFAAHGGGACTVERRVSLSDQMAGNIESGTMRARRLYFSDRAPQAAAPGCVVLCDNECGAEYVWLFNVDTLNMKHHAGGAAQ